VEDVRYEINMAGVVATALAVEGRSKVFAQLATGGPA
jgi:hypothetical protein